MSAGENSLETLVSHDRAIVATALALLLVLAWAYTVAMAIDVPEADRHAAMGMDTGAWMPWTGIEAALIFVMWVVMMVAMMMPAAAPMVLTYVRINRQRAPVSSRFGTDAAFLLGYLVLWGLFSLAAATAQWLLHTATLLSPAMASASPVFSALLLIAAGFYQFAPLKSACLAKCRSPMGFLMSEWRNGVRGAFIMGLRHGLYCLGCCWLLMVLLFVAGVMNLLWIALIALAVLAEKVLPFGVWVSRALGVALTAGGIGLLALP
jgi:predicted metal-binding membrane protein